MNRRPRAIAAISLAGACALAVPAAAGAKTTHSTLRVEGPNRALDAGTNYSNGSIVTRNSSACGPRRSKRERLTGANATGIVGHAARVNGRLTPFRTSDTFSFGLIICQIGALKGFESTAWLYKVNHSAPSVGGDQFPVGRGDDVLWYFANFSTGNNTGDELELRNVPDRVRPGDPFQVNAVAWTFDGKRSPAQNVRVSGRGVIAGPTRPDGRTTVIANETGVISVRGTRGNDISAAPVNVCVSRNLSRCPARRGETFVGTNRADKIAATRGADAIRARGGRDTVLARGGEDRVNVRGGGRDRVNCGSGRDVAKADRRDIVNRNCERVRR